MNDSSRFVCIDGFAEELDEIIYEGISNWFISFRSLFTVYSAHFSYLLIFFSIIGCGVLSHRHSVENGKKYTQFWLGALIYGVVSEFGLTATKYWHAQAPVMFMGKQLPLHIVFLYPSILYLAMMAVQRLNLNVCTEPAAVGLIAMFMEIPFRMISVKFLHITYHDSDPIFYHKLYGVPWVEIFSSLVFSSSYVAVYHGIKYYQSRDLSTIWDKSAPSSKEVMSTVISGICSPVIGFIQKILLFHFLHDFFNVNPASCLFFVFTLYLSLVICFEPKKMQKSSVEDCTRKLMPDNPPWLQTQPIEIILNLLLERPVILKSTLNEDRIFVTIHCIHKVFLFYEVVIYLTCLLYLAVFGKPQNEVSIGTHEPTGDCTMLICSRTPLGRETQTRKFLCTSDLCKRSHFLYNFDCLPNGAPSFNAIWYTICGTSFRNRANFLVLIFSCSLFIIAIYMRTLFEAILKRLMRKYLYRRKSSLCQESSVRKPLKRKKFLCADEVASRKYFVYNFDCLEEGPPCLSAIWYTICGSPIFNKPQFFLNVFSFILLLSTLFSKTLFSDATQLEAAKRLIVRFRSEFRGTRLRNADATERREESPQPSTEEVTVGFVLIKNDIHLLPKTKEHFKSKIN